MANACGIGGDFITPCPPYESPTLAYSCTDFDSVANSCITYDWVEVPAAASCAASLNVNDPAVGQLIGNVAYILFLAWFFNFLFKYIMNR